MAKSDPKSTKKEAKPKKQEPSVIADNTVLELTIPWKTAQRAYNQVLQAAAKKVKAHGFRPGKLPLKMAEDRIGRAELIERALNQVVPAAYQKLIEKEQKNPLTQPDITPKKLDWEADWVLEVQIAEPPSVKLGDYKKAVKAGKKAHQEEHEKGKKDNGKTDKQGKKGADHSHDHQHDEDEHQLQHIFKELVTTIKPQIPELLLKEQTRSEMQRLARSLEPMKLSLDDYLKRRGMTFEQLSQELATVALGQLQVEYILQEIVNTEKLQATDKEIKAKQEEMVKKGTPKEQLETPYAQSYLNNIITREKVLDHLLKL